MDTDTVPGLATRPATTDVLGDPRRRYKGVWLPAIAAAAVLAVSISIVMYGRQVTTGLPPGQTLMVAMREADRFVDRHTSCSKDITRLHRAGQFTQDLKVLPGELKTALGGRPIPSLDLKEATGFSFKAVGKCTLPGKGAVHLIYGRKNPKTGADESMSLWMLPYRRRRGCPASIPTGSTSPSRARTTRSCSGTTKT